MARSFYRELTLLLNQHSMENTSNTPDWILAQFLMGCLESFDKAVQQRDSSCGLDARPSETVTAKDEDDGVAGKG